MEKPSKFNKPQRDQKRDPTPAQIDQVINKAETRDDPVDPAQGTEVRFTMVLPADMATRVDVARKAAGGMARLAWIRLAIAEKLGRDGM